MKQKAINVSYKPNPKDLPDFSTVGVMDELPQDNAILSTSNPTGGGTPGQKVLNTTDGTLWVYTNKWNQVQLGGGAPLDPTTWAGIQAIVRAGKAQEYFQIGDEIDCGQTFTNPDNGESYSMPMLVIDFRNVELENGKTVPGMMILSKYSIIGNMWTVLDSSGSIDGTAYSSGYYDWRNSLCRQYLNSDGLNWYSSKFDEGTDWAISHNSAHIRREGFLDSVSNDLTSVLTPTKVSTQCNTSGSPEFVTSYDKFFILSAEELYFAVKYDVEDGQSYNSNPNTAVKEGGPTAYFAQKTYDISGSDALSIPGGDAVIERVGKDINGQADSVFGEFSRSPWYQSGVAHCCTISKVGKWSNAQVAAGIFPIRPATVIC